MSRKGLKNNDGHLLEGTIDRTNNQLISESVVCTNRKGSKTSKVTINLEEFSKGSFSIYLMLF